MTLLARLLGRLLPACAVQGAQGVPLTTFDVTRLTRPSSPNSALAAPAGFAPAPDRVTPTYPVPPRRLFAVLRAVAARQARTFLASEGAAGLQAQWVARSRVLNFPDLISAQVMATPSGESQLVLYSRSLYGYSDFGANRSRLEAWLASIDAAIEVNAAA
ncbi:MAG TPA: DUF1499 domain-containing protein [Acetobacteraceae bacterium]|nr:DUF1499 domain-containing protein [Acetobacteraceae bacterium]